MKILLAALTSSFMLAACTPRIEVAAPKEPITINMNVKINCCFVNINSFYYSVCSKKSKQ